VCSKVYVEAAIDVRTVRQWVRQIKEGETGGATVLQDNSEVVVLALHRYFCFYDPGGSSWSVQAKIVVEAVSRNDPFLPITVRH